MTAHEYLNQVYYLNRKIKYDLASLEELRELSCSIGSPSWGEKVEGSRNYDGKRKPKSTKSLQGLIPSRMKSKR